MEEIRELNLAHIPLSAAAMAWLACELEQHGTVLVRNVAPGVCPGFAAFSLGQFLTEAVQAKKDGKW